MRPVKKPFMASGAPRWGPAEGKLGINLGKKERKRARSRRGLMRVFPTNGMIGVDVFIYPRLVIILRKVNFQPFQKVAEHIIPHGVGKDQGWSPSQLSG